MKIVIFLTLFVIIFVTKLHGVLDISFLLALMLSAFCIFYIRDDYPLQFVPYALFLFLLACYASFISLLNGAVEIIFFLKFVRTFLLFILLYYVVSLVQKKVNYDDFSKYFVLMVAMHSLVILCAIVSPEFRQGLYSMTGYEPRGPEWSRSPGLTISFNATAIVHVVGLWFLLSRKDWASWKRWLIGLLIMVSFIFLGRFIAFVGLLAILVLLLFEYSWKKRLLVAFVALLAMPIMQGISNLEYDVSTVKGQVLSNYHHFTDPLLMIGEEGGADSYFEQSLSKHIYFSDKWYVLLFGNSHAGHIGVQNGTGETDSDLGVINSINANGMIITLSIYIFYILLIWESRNSDWKPIALVALLSLVLSFKETGLFTSHASSLLFILLFYGFFERQSREKRGIE